MFTRTTGGHISCCNASDGLTATRRTSKMAFSFGTRTMQQVDVFFFVNSGGGEGLQFIRCFMACHQMGSLYEVQTRGVLASRNCNTHRKLCELWHALENGFTNLFDLMSEHPAFLNLKNGALKNHCMDSSALLQVVQSRSATRTNCTERWRLISPREILTISLANRTSGNLFRTILGAGLVYIWYRLH